MFEREEVDFLLRTFSAVSHLPVFSVETGEKLGVFADLYINKHGQVTGFLLDKKSFFQRDLFLPLESIYRIGQDSIFVYTDKFAEKPTASDVYPLKQGKRRFYGKPLLTLEGEKLGIVEDVYFQEELGTVIGYELTEGLLADLIEGRKVVKTNAPLTVGEEVLVIRNDE